MAAPTTYTEKTLAQFMHLKLGKVAEALKLHLGAADAGDYAEAVNDALLAYGTDDISTISTSANIQKLRALAHVAAWRHVVNNFAALFDFSADGASYNRSQLFEHARQALQLAEEAAISYTSIYKAKLIRVDHLEDPYRVTTEDELER